MNKNNFISILFGTRIIFILGFLMIGHAGLLAQHDEDKPDKKEKARMSLEFTNVNNIGPRLKATVKTKVDKSYENVPGVKVHFYLGEVGEESKMGYAVTSKDGSATLILPESLRKTIAKQYDFLYVATIENDDRFKDTETEIEIKRSYTELTLVLEDSVKQVRFFVGAPDSTGTIIPAEEVEARIYVKRLFGLLPVSEEFEQTDEEGILRLEFPDDIPGDENGTLTIVAQVEDHEEFGNLMFTKKIDWGVPLSANGTGMSRELWSARANAPISLIIITNVLIIGIWGIIGYIIFQLRKIYKIGKAQIESQKTPQ